MAMIPIELGIARPHPKGAGDRPSPQAQAGKMPPELKQRIFERDDYTCRCCGFHAKKYQEIHCLDHNYTNWQEKNLITVCVFCQQCFNIHKASQMRSGLLIWLPEIEQKDLHHIARAIYVARVSQGPVAETARKALDILMNRREEAKKRISTDNPYILSMVLADYLPYKHYQQRVKKLEGIRLFPLDRRFVQEAGLKFNQFPQILAYWRSKDGPFGDKKPDSWIGLYRQLSHVA